MSLKMYSLSENATLMLKNFSSHKKKTTKDFSHKASQLLNKPSRKPPKILKEEVFCESQPKYENFSNSSQIRANFSSKDPPKFLQPIQTYDIYGFFFMYDRGFKENSERLGLFEAANFYRRINKIEKINANLNVIFCENINIPVIPYPLIISRLISLNDTLARDLAIIIEKFCVLQDETLSPNCEKTEENWHDYQLDLKNNANSLMHSLAFEEIQEFHEETENFEIFTSEEEFKAYDEYLKKNENFLKNHQEKPIYACRYKAKVGGSYYKTMQHFYSTMYAKMICPDESFYLSILFREGLPNPIKCANNYFQSIFSYLKNLYDTFIRNSDEMNCSIEIEQKEKEKFGFIFETLDGFNMPVGIKLSVDIFKGKKFIDIVKRTIFEVSEENLKILMSDERKRNFVQKFKIRELTSGEEKGKENEKMPKFLEEKEFISIFYPGVIPKNEISRNQSKICKFREIKHL